MVLRYMEASIMPERKRPHRILKIGCGSGVLLGELSNEAINFCVGIEPDEELRGIAGKRMNGSVLQGSLPDNLPPFDEPFHTVIEDDQAAVDAVRELLQIHGQLILNVPAMPSLWSVHDEVNQHKRRYRYQALSKLFRSEFWSVKRMNYWGSSLALPACISRQLANGKQSKSNYRVSIPPDWLNRTMFHYTCLDERISRFLRIPYGLSLFACVERVR